MDYNLEKFSVSKLLTFVTCPFNFYATYVLKLPSEEEAPFANIGSALHEILEHVNKDMQEGLFLKVDSYSLVIKDRVKKFHLHPVNEMKFGIYLSEYINKVFHLLKSSMIIGVEKKFHVDFPTPWKIYKFTGIMDLVVIYGGRAYIYDYKSKLKETLALEYMLTRDLQVQGYSWVVSMHGDVKRGVCPEICFTGKGIPVERYGHIQFIDKDQTTKFIYNDVFNYSELVQRITYWLKKIEECISDQYFPRVPSYCFYCNHKKFCLKI